MTNFDLLGFIMDYEQGLLGTEQIADGFQHMIDNEIVWYLQGSYGRTAHELIKAGLCTPREATIQ